MIMCSNVTVDSAKSDPKRSAFIRPLISKTSPFNCTTFEVRYSRVDFPLPAAENECDLGDRSHSYSCILMSEELGSLLLLDCLLSRQGIFLDRLCLFECFLIKSVDVLNSLLTG